MSKLQKPIHSYLLGRYIYAKKGMEEKESMKFTEWVDTLTISDAMNVFLMTAFTIVILWLVVRTFRGKSSA